MLRLTILSEHYKVALEIQGKRSVIHTLDTIIDHLVDYKVDFVNRRNVSREDPYITGNDIDEEESIRRT